ncbi:MAG: sensor histidine kinase [Elusimicrobiota bacterium]
MSQEAPVWQAQSLEALKAIGKVLGQMSLYRVGHPEVAETIKAAFDALQFALARSGAVEISFSINQGQIVANGRLIGPVGRVPTAVPALFERLKIGSLTFKSGLSLEELGCFCEIATLRRDSSDIESPGDYLARRKIEHIGIDEAVYAKVKSDDEIVARARTSADVSVPGLAAALSAQKTIAAALESLVSSLALESGERDAVRMAVMGLLENDVRRRVEDAVKPLREIAARLEGEQARAEGVLHQAVEGVITVDEQGKILMMNPVAEQVWGAPLSQAAGASLVEKAGENQVVTLASDLIIPIDRPLSAQARVAAKEDVRRAVQSSGAVVQTEEGRIVGVVSGLTDAAKYREIERMQRDFVAHVTHELRAPLSSIRAALEIIQGEAAPILAQEHMRMLQTAVNNSDRLSALINSILDFSKIEAGRMEVYPAKEDAAALAREGVEGLEPWARKKKIKLSCEAQEPLAAIWADKARTIQVLVNLLSNAIKFTPSGGSVSVRVERYSSEGRGFARFCVADTGPGIAKAQQDKIFQKFVQIVSGDFQPGGTGLGLSISKALVHLQKGRLWLESAEGKGSSFFFTLPLFAASDSKAGQSRLRPWWKRILGL